MDTEEAFLEHAPGVAYIVMIKGVWDGVSWMLKLKGLFLEHAFAGGGLRTVVVLDALSPTGHWTGCLGRCADGTFIELAFAGFWQLWLLLSSLLFPRGCGIVVAWRWAPKGHSLNMLLAWRTSS